MDTNGKTPETLLEAVKHFADLKVCFAYMTKVKWPDGNVVCPKCGGDQVGMIASRCMFQCKHKECRKQFSAKLGTIFEDSPLGLDKWFVAVWCITNAKNGISSCELARALGVTQKTAWFMLHRVRHAMHDKSFFRMTGTVEADEHHLGGLAKNMKSKKRHEKIRQSIHWNKTIVAGLLERAKDGCSRARLTIVPDAKRPTIQDFVKKNVLQGSQIMTDENPAYVGLNFDYDHQFVNHAIQYVRGSVHTNGLENFWSLMSRMVLGTYVAIEPFHLGRYLDEQVYRFNNRKLTDGERFVRMMRMVDGLRLTYKELTGKTGANPVV